MAFAELGIFAGGERVDGSHPAQLRLSGHEHLPKVPLDIRFGSGEGNLLRGICVSPHSLRHRFGTNSELRQFNGDRRQSRSGGVDGFRQAVSLSLEVGHLATGRSGPSPQLLLAGSQPFEVDTQRPDGLPGCPLYHGQALEPFWIDDTVCVGCQESVDDLEPARRHAETLCGCAVGRRQILPFGPGCLPPAGDLLPPSNEFFPGPLALSLLAFESSKPLQQGRTQCGSFGTRLEQLPPALVEPLLFMLDIGDRSIGAGEALGCTRQSRFE